MLITEGCSDGRAELGIFGNCDAYAVEFFERYQHFAALRQQRKIADEDNVLDARTDACKDGCGTDGLEHCADNAKRHVFLRGIALGFA